MSTPVAPDDLPFPVKHTGAFFVFSVALTLLTSVHCDEGLRTCVPGEDTESLACRHNPGEENAAIPASTR